MEQISKTPYATKLVVNGKTLYCSDVDTASLVNVKYSQGKDGNVSCEANTLGGKITNPDHFLEFMNLEYDGESFAWLVHSESDVITPMPQIRKEEKVMPSTFLAPSFSKQFAGLEMSKKLSLLLYRYSQSITRRISPTQAAGYLGNSIGTESLKISKILRANPEVRLCDLTVDEKAMVDKEELVTIISAFSSVRETMTIFSPAEFLYYAVDYSDFDLYNLEGGGYILFFDEEYVTFDNNYGLVDKSPIFDSKLYQHKIKIDYFSKTLALEFMTFIRVVDVGKVANSNIPIKVNFTLPPTDYPGIQFNPEIDTVKFPGARSFEDISRDITAMLKKAMKSVGDEVTVAVSPDWHGHSQRSLAFAFALRRSDPEERKRLANDLANYGVRITAPMRDACSFAVLAEGLEETRSKFYVDYVTSKGENRKRWATVMEFIEGKGIEKTIGQISQNLRGLTTLSDSFCNVPMPSVNQWHRWVSIGREMRARSPIGNIGKEYALKRGYSCEVKGASTGDKNERTLVTFLDFFPDAVYECEQFHYVGVTANDHMLPNNWQFWLNAQGDRVKAQSSFHCYDINSLGTNVLKADPKFEVRQDDHFTTLPFQKLVDQEFPGERTFLYSDAFIVHSKDGLGYVATNPFKSKGAPPNWTPLLNKDDFPAPNEEEDGLYNFLSWCVAKYRCGVVKFHLDKKVRHQFWDIMGARFLKHRREFMLWKCGRPHNLEFHFFFNVYEQTAENFVDVVVPEKEEPSTTEVTAEQLRDALLKVKPALPTLPKKKTNPDRWAFLRQKALYYFICCASAAELHRNFHFVSPINEMKKLDILKAQKTEKKSNLAIIGSIPSGFYDPTYYLGPTVVSIKYGDKNVNGILIYGGGSKKLVSGISNILEGEDPSILESRKAMEEAFKGKNYVELNPEDGSANVPTLKATKPKLTKTQKKQNYWNKIRKHRSGDTTPKE